MMTVWAAGQRFERLSRMFSPAELNQSFETDTHDRMLGLKCEQGCQSASWFKYTESVTQFGKWEMN